MKRKPAGGSLTVLLSSGNELSPAILHNIELKDKPDQIYKSPDRYLKSIKESTVSNRALIAQLETILEGSFVVANEIHFSTTLENKSWPIAISPKYAQALFPLYVALRLGKIGSGAVILNKPDMGLHPSQQIALTRFLVQLVNAGAKIILLTHSDLILNELNACIMANTLSVVNAKVPCVETLTLYTSNKWTLNMSLVAAYMKKAKVEPVEIDKYGIDLEQFRNVYHSQTLALDNFFFAIEGLEG